MTRQSNFFLARNCNSRNGRETIVRQLQKSSFRVDALRKCLHNAEPEAGINLKDKINVMQHYLFYLAFENQNVDDYITEKFWCPCVLLWRTQHQAFSELAVDFGLRMVGVSLQFRLWL